MHFEPSKELKQFINSCVESGYYNSQAEVVRAALRRMQREEESRRVQIIEREPNETTLKAFQQVEDGDYTVSTFEEFKQQVQDLKND